MEKQRSPKILHGATQRTEETEERVSVFLGVGIPLSSLVCPCKHLLPARDENVFL